MFSNDKKQYHGLMMQLYTSGHQDEMIKMKSEQYLLSFVLFMGMQHFPSFYLSSSSSLPPSLSFSHSTLMLSIYLPPIFMSPPSLQNHKFNLQSRLLSSFSTLFFLPLSNPPLNYFIFFSTLVLRPKKLTTTKNLYGTHVQNPWSI